jgi:hypothetical protein
LHEHRDEVVELVRWADRRTIDQGRDPSEQDVFAVEFDREPIDERLTILGWEMEAVDGDGGRSRLRPSQRETSWSDVPYLARYIAKRTVRRPRGYLISPPDPQVLAALLRHGIAVDRLVEPATLAVESFEVTSVRGSRRPNQGHFTSSVDGSYSISTRTLPAGSLWVTSAQALGHLAASLLEPESDDGLLVWNFLDRYLAAQWGDDPQTCPVFKVFASAHLVTERVDG